ncbi:MAG: hypothetical protein R2838_17215 [Caldilineaceae bacterium]
MIIEEGYWHPGETYVEKPEVSAVNRATWAPAGGPRGVSKCKEQAVTT